MVKSGGNTTRECGDRLAQTLRSIYPNGTAKLISRDTGIPRRSVERLLDGSSAPSFETFVVLLGAYPRLLEALAPAVGWAEAALAAVECDALDRRRDELYARRDSLITQRRGVL